jgi:hypothetical protein
MNEADRQLLDRYAPALQEELNLTVVVTILQQSGVLTDVDLEEIKVILLFNHSIFVQDDNRYNANFKFLRILKTRGPNALFAFYNALLQTGQQHLAQLLEEATTAGRRFSSSDGT